MDIDWQSVLLGSIPGFLVLIGAIYGKVQDRRAKREEANQTAAARREPTWNELVTENRNLREEVTKQGDEIERIKNDLSSYKRATNRKFTAFENVLRDIFHQWPKDHEYPLFNSDDLTELRDADIPWRDRIRTLPGIS